MLKVFLVLAVGPITGLCMLQIIRHRHSAPILAGLWALLAVLWLVDGTLALRSLCAYVATGGR